MRRLFRLLLLPVFLVIGGLTMNACGSSSPPLPASGVLSAMLAAAETTAQPLPDGMLYNRAAPPDAPAYLSETLFSALYGEAARGLLSSADGGSEPAADPPAVGDAALYLSLSAHPCELAVLRCVDGSAARTVAGLCCTRLELLARSAGEQSTAEGRVEIHGNYVLFAFCEDPVPLLEAAKKEIK